MICDKQGLHARPAAAFVQLANRYKSDIKVRKGRRQVDGKSIMGVLSLGAASGSYITIEAEGEDAEEAIERLSKLLNS